MELQLIRCNRIQSKSNLAANHAGLWDGLWGCLCVLKITAMISPADSLAFSIPALTHSLVCFDLEFSQTASEDTEGQYHSLVHEFHLDNPCLTWIGLHVFKSLILLNFSASSCCVFFHWHPLQQLKRCSQLNEWKNLFYHSTGLGLNPALQPPTMKQASPGWGLKGVTGSAPIHDDPCSPLSCRAVGWRIS